MAITVVNLTDTFDEWRVKTNTLGTNTGDLTTLSTTAKGTLVAAINEIFTSDSDDLENIVEDTSPQLGGDLVLNSNDITGTGNINTTGNITITGTATSVVFSSSTFTGSAPSITSTASSNGDITISPDGTGDINLETDKVKIGSSGEDVTVTTNGSGTLFLTPNDGGSTNPEVQLENAGHLRLTTHSSKNVIVSGQIVATTFSGDLSGTINTATTGTTQSAGNNSTLIATTAFVTAAVTSEDTIAEMNDTTISSSANLDLLQYNSSSSVWENKAIGAVVGTTQSASNNSTLLATTAYVDAQVSTENTIDEMDDTTISSEANLDLLQYNSSTSKWVNTAIGSVVGATQAAGNNSTLLATTAFVTAAVTSEDQISEMNDVTITSIANDHILQYNSTSSVWENQVLSAGVSIDDATALAIALG